MFMLILKPSLWIRTELHIFGSYELRPGDSEQQHTTDLTQENAQKQWYEKDHAAQVLTVVVQHDSLHCTGEIRIRKKSFFPSKQWSMLYCNISPFLCPSLLSSEAALQKVQHHLSGYLVGAKAESKTP